MLHSSIKISETLLTQFNSKPSMDKSELVFIPSPWIGHIVSTVEFAKCLLDRDDNLSITIMIIRPIYGSYIETKINSIVASCTRVRFHSITPVDPQPASMSVQKNVSDYIEAHKPHVEHAIMTEFLSEDSMQLAGIVVDMYCTSMVDVAYKLKVPSYLFFASPAAFLGFLLYLPVHHNRAGAEFDHSLVESIVPSYRSPVPTSVMPNFAFNKDGYTSFLRHATRYEETWGFIINTFVELEPHALNSLITTSPTIYAVGPLLGLKPKEPPIRMGSKWDEIMTWLDDQPHRSVLFLCFGSEGFFGAPQLEQISMALGHSGIRFLWSIRRPPPEGTLFPTEYKNVQEALPEGFLERTEKRGRVCGWAPQAEVLARPAIGGFVSHCGWNSCLESLWHGVPIATWPLYAEQQLNAFQLVEELGLAVDLKMDYRLGSEELVMSDVIESAITKLMADDNPVRKRVKEMSEKSRKAVMEGGSSYASVGHFIEDMRKNITLEI